MLVSFTFWTLATSTVEVQNYDDGLICNGTKNLSTEIKVFTGNRHTEMKGIWLTLAITRL